MFHIATNGCQDVQIQGVKIIAAGDSPNYRQMWKYLIAPLKPETIASRLAPAPQIYGSSKSLVVPIMALGFDISNSFVTFTENEAMCLLFTY